jgi:hypothetical protein
MKIIFRQLGGCYHGAISLTRGQVCIYSCCWASPAQSFSGFNHSGLMIILYSINFEIPQLEEPSSSFISSRKRMAQLWPRALHNQTRKVNIKVTLRPTVSQPVGAGVRPSSENRDQFLFLLLDTSGFLNMAPPLCNLWLLLVLTTALPWVLAPRDSWP